MTDIGNEVSHSLFISDLHLCASRPAIIKAFINFLQNTASKAERLYILGDLFEYWAGDDDIDHADHAEIIHALKLLSDSGTTNSQKQLILRYFQTQVKLTYMGNAY